MTQPTNTINTLTSGNPGTAGGISRLSNWVNSSETNIVYLTEFEDYYNGKHSLTGLSQLQKTNSDLFRFWRPVNIIPSIIKEPIGYILAGTFKIEASNPNILPWAEAWYKKRFKPAIPRLIRFSSCFRYAFCYLWTDTEGVSKGLKIRVLAPIENGKRRVIADFGSDDETELTGVVLEYNHPTLGGKTFRQKRMTLTAEEIIEEELDSFSENKIIGSNAVGNPWGILPVTVCENQNSSDLIEIIPLQDDLNINSYDLRASRAYHGFPMLTSADPIQGSVGPGKIISGTNITRIEPADLSQLITSQDKIYEQIAMIAGSVKMAQRPGATISGEAIKWLMSSLMVKCNAKAEELAQCAAATLTSAARMLAVDKELFNLEKPSNSTTTITQADFANVEFTVTITPKPPADETQATIAAAQALGAGLYSQREALSRAGYSRADALRVAKERLEEQSGAEAGTSELQDQTED